MYYYFSRFSILLASMMCIVLAPGSAASEIHIVHCLYGCPTGMPSTNDLVIREIYSLSSNDDRKFADWVAYRVTRSTIGKATSLDRDWKKDPALEDIETLEKKDYTGSHKALGVDRGHQAPLAAFANTVYWRDTNYLSNITPQKKELNQGPWKALEEAVRDLAYEQEEIYVITGPLYEGSDLMSLPEADEQHTVPSGYWKIIATIGGKVASFVFDQDDLEKYCDMKYKAAVSDIEERSGLDLFPNAPVGWERGSLRKHLGC